VRSRPPRRERAMAALIEKAQDRAVAVHHRQFAQPARDLLLGGLSKVVVWCKARRWQHHVGRQHPLAVRLASSREKGRRVHEPSSCPSASSTGNVSCHPPALVTRTRTASGVSSRKLCWRLFRPSSRTSWAPRTARQWSSTSLRAPRVPPLAQPFAPRSGPAEPSHTLTCHRTFRHA